MGTELLALAAGSDSAGKILTATDRRNMEFLDILIENEQKETIAHSVVQRYLQVGLRGYNTCRVLKALFDSLQPMLNIFSGIVARKLELGFMENYPHVFNIYFLPSCLDLFHSLSWP